MSKGKGECESRTSLVIDNNISEIENSLSKLKSFTENKLSSLKEDQFSEDNIMQNNMTDDFNSILKEDNFEHLNYLIDNPKNHIEYVLAKYRLEQLYELEPSKIKFEKQDLTVILEDVKKHPNEVRALFFDDNNFVDKLIYIYYDTNKDKFIFLTDVEKDDDFYENIDLEFSLVNHQVENAQGLSKSQGKKLHSKLDKNDLYYTPNNIKLKGQLEHHYFHNIEIPEITDDDIEYINSNLRNSFKKHYTKIENFYLETHKYKNPKFETTYRLMNFARLKEEYKEDALRAAQTGQPIIRDKGKKYERKMYLTPATSRDMERFEKYMPKVKDGVYMYYRPYNKYKSMLESNNKLKKLSKQIIKLDLLQELNKEDIINNAEAKSNIQQKLELNLDKYQLNFIQFHLNKSKLNITKKSKEKTVVNNLPISELGILKIESKNPEKVINKLQEKNIVGNLIPEVPYNQIYNNHNYRGKITFMYNHYINPENKIKLNNDFVIHGLTGANNNPANHLDIICKLGGLKSIAERRRFNLATVGVSPIGDMGSNIDKGIPTTIGIQPTFGGHNIFFVLKDDIIKRRDVFFSNQDYGGSEGRYNSYMNYAKSIGQKDIHTPPNHQARINHLKNGLASSNEAYFHDEIRLDEVDAIFINTAHYNQVIKIVDKYKENGLWHKDLKIVKFSSSNYHSAFEYYKDLKKKVKLKESKKTKEEN